MGVDAAARARVVGIDPTFRDLRGGRVRLLPQSVGLIGQGSTTATYAIAPFLVSSAAQVGQTFGFGSPLHLAALALLPATGDGLGLVPLTIYPVTDAGTASAGSITPVGTQGAAAEYRVVVNGIRSAPFTVGAGDVPSNPLAVAIAAAINGTLAMPVVASDTVNVVDLVSKWKGTSANKIFIEIEGVIDGLTFTLVQPVGGLANPDIQEGLDSIGPDVWETILVNCNEYDDVTSLDTLQAFGDLRAGALEKKPLVAFTGTELNFTELTTITNVRKTDRVNGYAVVGGSTSLPCMIAGRWAARVAAIANNNPPVDYARAKLDAPVVAGADEDQLTYLQRNQVMTQGASTSVKIDGLATISDAVLFYHPDGEDPPAFRHVVDVIKLMNVIFNLKVIFEAAEWDGAPLIPDNQPTTNPAARKPKDAKAAVNSMLDGLGDEAIISDPESAKALTTAVIDSGNPKRLNVGVTVQLAGNTNVISVDLFFGFFFGTQELIA